MNDKENNSYILLKRRLSVEERNFTKLYNLSKLNDIQNITLEEKIKLLSTIKAILLCTNDSIKSCISLPSIHYIIKSIKIFVTYFLVNIIYNFIFNNEELHFKHIISFTFSFLYYNIFTLIELILINIAYTSKERRVKNIMYNFAMNELSKIRNKFIVIMKFGKFDLIVHRINHEYNILFNKLKKKFKIFIKQCNFFQYVIVYPNFKYLYWDEKILNETEIEIMKEINIKEMIINNFKKGFHSSWISSLLYFIFFDALAKNRLHNIFICGAVIFVFEHILIYFYSGEYKKNFKEKEEIVNKKYIIKGYFVHIDIFVVEIFKLKNDDVKNISDIQNKIRTLKKKTKKLNENVYIW